MNKKKDQVSYILSLLGKKRTSVLNDVSNTSDWEFERKEESVFENMDVIERMLQPLSIADDLNDSKTKDAQNEVETVISDIYKKLLDGDNNDGFNKFKLKDHLKYIKKSLEDPLPHYFKILDASGGWLIYWLINSYVLITDTEIESGIKQLVSKKIKRNIIDEGLGGIGGGPNQLGHVASTYASVLALIIIEDFETLGQLKSHLYSWFMKLKQPNGAFIMHENGEYDTRSTYCVLVVSSLLNIVTDELTQNTLKWINSCQSYEGGFSGVPGAESHGGYTYCAFASYFLLIGKSENVLVELKNNIDVDNLIRWAVMRQSQVEGSLNGRSNKLVDACYSFWVGSLFPLLECVNDLNALFDRDALRIYILHCAQNIAGGGFKDKPGKSVDFYHTNYSICGLSICEYSYDLRAANNTRCDSLAYCFDSRSYCEEKFTKPVNPIFGIPLEFANKVHKYFISN